MRKLGSRFVLNDDAHARFYREVARQGIAEGYAVISALVCDEAVVATTFVRSGASYFLLRISHAGDFMVELLAGAARHRTDHGGAACRGRAPFRSQHRQPGLQAPLRRREGRIDRCQHRTVLARRSLCMARPYRAEPASLSQARRLRQPGDAQMRRRRPPAPASSRKAGTEGVQQRATLRPVAEPARRIDVAKGAQHDQTGLPGTRPLLRLIEPAKGIVGAGDDERRGSAAYGPVPA